MWDAELARQRRLMFEAFVAGWQAALAVRVNNPAARAIVESCFEMWLNEEVDERPVLGLPFRRRFDLPEPGRLPRQRKPPAIETGATLPRRAATVHDARSAASPK